ncbi:MAG: hypothetical protein ACE5HC_02135 [Candidatus Binatia bacterium]
MKSSTFYNQALRAIGQALEAERMDAFDLRSSGDTYLVRGKPAKRNPLQALLQKWQGRDHREQESWQLSYSSADIARLEQLGRGNRREAHRLPDFYSQSSILRTLGAYLDMKGAQLLQVSRKELTIMILYRTNRGHPELEERSISSFYNLYLQMYQKRQSETQKT